ncbi:MAG: Holliday junction branch migration protein RuvA [Lachnospiraceae bacterium]|nr:Holliday junction branch migration protein RuvA [Lachnospiraceae bacterium]
MIAFIKGELAETRPGVIVVEAGGLGYEINVPSSLFGKLPGIGGTVLIHTYFQVREDGVSLFGFLKKDDLEVFKLLIGVNGIGPKGALGVLSSITADNLRFAVLAEDTKTLEKLPGIGKKTAGRLILDLKDKFGLEEAFEQKLENVKADTEQAGISDAAAEEAIQALTALGYPAAEALKAVRQVTITPEMTAEDVLRLSLKNFGR